MDVFYQIDIRSLSTYFLQEFSEQMLDFVDVSFCFNRDYQAIFPCFY